MAELPESAKVVIIGGGAIGLSVTYHLGRLGWSDLVLLERHELTSGTSWHAAGIVGPLRANLNLTRLAVYATELFVRLEAETGQATGYRQTGGLWLAQSQDRMTELTRIAAMGEASGLDVRILSAAQAQEAMPLMHIDDLAGALWVAEDGQTNPVDTCLAYAKGARDAGVQIHEHSRVTAVNSTNGAVNSAITSTGHSIRCEYLVNCAGLWSRQVGEMAGVPVPAQAVEHMYVVTEPIAELPKPCPVLRDLDSRIYVKEDAGKLVIGGFEPNAKLWHPPDDGSEGGYLVLPEDWDQFEPFMHAALNRLPVLEQTGIRHFMNGPESFTPDTRQLMGESPNLKNYFVAAGFSSIGIMSSAGVGKALAEWIVDGEPPMDLWAVDIARADPLWNDDAFLQERTQEAVANQFNMHWPFRQMETGRDLRRSSLHQALDKAGAVYGAPTGWERPLWFARNENERKLRYSYGAQPWWEYAAREAEAVQNRVALLELSPFTKIKISGPDAESLLQRLCTGDVAIEPGCVRYTLMLNRRGGIEADITVRRVSKTEFRIVSGAATRWKDLAWIRRAIRNSEKVSVTDITEDHAVLGVVGPLARKLLQSVCDEDLSNNSFPFSTARALQVQSVQIVAQRTSFSGELGYELYIPLASAQRCYETVRAAGSAFGLSHAGHYCLNACRVEKGFRHWGHDIGSEDSPLEAGLSFAVDMDKDFTGRDGLAAQKHRGVGRHLLLFAVDSAHPLLLHDEPVYRDERLVGLTTSGERGFRTGLSLCFAYVKAEPGEGKEELLAGSYEIGVAGKRYSLTALKRLPYDPDGTRMRS
ncbi:MAG: GcvT family protein [Gammaproteobacteria bacterium]